MRTRTRSFGPTGLLLGGLLWLLPVTLFAINKNAATTGPTDWTAGGAWVDDGGSGVGKPVAGDAAFIGRAVTGSAVPASIDVTTSEAADYVLVGYGTANGSVLHVTASGALNVSQQLAAGHNGVDGTIVIDGTVVAGDLRAGSGTGGTITLNSGGAMTATTLFVGHGANSVFNHNGGTWSVGNFYCFYSGSGSTLNLNGNSIAVTNMYFGASGGSGTINRGGANILSAGYWHVDGGTVTFEPGDSAGGTVRAHNGGVLTLNVDLTMTAGQSVHVSNGDATLKLNGHHVTVSGGGSFHMGSSGGPGILDRTGGGNIITTHLLVDGGSAFTLETGDSIAGSARAHTGGIFILNRDLTLAAGQNFDISHGGTLRLNGHNLTLSGNGIFHPGAYGAPGILDRTGGGNISTTHLQVDSGSEFTLEAGDSIAGSARAHTGGIFILNRDLTLAAGQNFDISHGGTLRLNGHNLTLSGNGIFHPGAYGAPGILDRTGGGSISAPRLQVDHGSDYTYESGDNVTDEARAYNGGKITLARALALTGQLWISNNNGTRDAEVVMAGHDIAVGQFDMNAGGRITRTGGGTITAQRFQIRDGVIMDARPGDTASSLLDFYQNGVIAVTQSVDDVTGLTLDGTDPNPDNGLLYLNSFTGALLRLSFDQAPSPNGGEIDWAFRWKHPAGGGNRVAALQAFKDGGKIEWSGGVTNVTILDGGDGYTYVGYEIPAIVFVTEDTGARVNVTTNGGANGVIVLNEATGGTAPYEYSKDGGATWQAGRTFSGLSAGIYPMRAKDANGYLSARLDVPITQPTPLYHHYVSPAAAPWSGSGTQADPYGTLELALQQAMNTAGNHIIHLAPGTYVGGSRNNDPFFHGGVPVGSLGADFFVAGCLSLREGGSYAYSNIVIRGDSGNYSNTVISSAQTGQPVDPHPFFYFDQATVARNIVFEDVTIDADSSASGLYSWLIGHVGQGPNVDITFRRCQVLVGAVSLMRLDPGDTQGTMLTFEASDLYWEPRGDGMNIQSALVNEFPRPGLVHGDTASRLFWRNGAQYDQITNLFFIAASDGVTTWLNGNYHFVTGFVGPPVVPPPPTGLIMLVR